MSEDECAPRESRAKVQFSSLTNTRKLVPLIEKSIDKTDPFYFDNGTWNRFLREVAPQLFLALMLDMKVVPMAKRAEFARHMMKVMIKVSVK